MSLLVQPNRVVLAILLPAGIVMTQVVAGVGVHVAEVVASSERLTVYGDVLAVRKITYPILLVVRLSM